MDGSIVSELFQLLQKPSRKLYNNNLFFCKPFKVFSKNKVIFEFEPHEF